MAIKDLGALIAKKASDIDGVVKKQQAGEAAARNAAEQKLLDVDANINTMIDKFREHFKVILCDMNKAGSEIVEHPRQDVSSVAVDGAPYEWVMYLRFNMPRMPTPQSPSAQEECRIGLVRGKDKSGEVTVRGCWSRSVGSVAGVEGVFHPATALKDMPPDTWYEYVIEKMIHGMMGP